MNAEILALIIQGLSLVLGHMSDILKVYHAAQTDPDSVDLEELQRKIDALGKL